MTHSRKQVMMICLVVLVYPVLSYAVQPYATDFSSDPGWTTDQPSNYYWDGTNEWFHAGVENLAPAYQPNRYFYEPLSGPNGAFRLTWDFQVIQNDSSASIDFGLFDSQLRSSAGPPGQGIFATIGTGDLGRAVGLYVDGAGGRAIQLGPYDVWSLDTWYTAELFYDSAGSSVAFRLADQATNSTLWQDSLGVPGGSFSSNLVLLGGSRYGMGDDGNYSGVNQFAILTANIDNVSLTPIPVPGAAALVMTGIASVSIVRRRRRLV